MTLRWFDGFETNRSKAALATAYANVSTIQNAVTWKTANSRVGGYHLVVAFQTQFHTMTVDAIVHNINPNTRDTIIIGFAFRADVSEFHKNKSYRIVRVLDDAALSSAVEQFEIRLVAAADGKTYKWRVKANQLTVAETASIYANNEWYYVEFEVKVHNTTGTVKIVVDGSIVVNVTAKDTSTKGSGVWGHVTVDLPGRTATLEKGDFRFDDYYIISVEASGNNNTFMGDIIMEPVFPNADSVVSPTPYNDWTLFGAGLTKRYEAVDDALSGAIDDDVSYVWTVADNQKQTFAISTLGYISQNILGISWDIDVRLRTAGSKNIAPLFWSAGTGLVTHPDISVSSTKYALKRFILEVASGSSFDADVLTAGVEYGFESKA